MLSLLNKTLQKTTHHIASILGDKKDKLNKNELETILIECDIDYDMVEYILSALPSYISREHLSQILLEILESTPLESARDSNDSQNNALENPQSLTHSQQNMQTPQKSSIDSMDSMDSQPPAQPSIESSHNATKADSQNTPMVYVIVGVNGAGKTTTIAKLAKCALDSKKKVMLAAGDTFRAAAIEQLKLWGEKLQIPVIATQHLYDPSAVAFDSINAALAKGYDELYIDTAGRLENKINLKNELLKIIRVCKKALKAKEHCLKALLVLDGTQGSAAINQAKAFCEIIDFSGIIITKLDGTSKGGAIFSIVKELGVPILYLGTGENANDLIAFNAKDYVDSLLTSIFRT